MKKTPKHLIKLEYEYLYQNTPLSEFVHCVLFIACRLNCKKNHADPVRQLKKYILLMSCDTRDP